MIRWIDELHGETVDFEDNCDFVDTLKEWVNEL